MSSPNPQRVAAPGSGTLETEKLGPQQHSQLPVRKVGSSKIPSMFENSPPTKEMLEIVDGATRDALLRALGARTPAKITIGEGLRAAPIGQLGFLPWANRDAA